jgi:hypothetical protein
VKRFLLFLTIAATIACASLCDAEEPVPLQLYLMDQAGKPVDGPRDMRFCFYLNDKKVSCETRTKVPAKEGSIQISLRPPSPTRRLDSRVELEVGIKFGPNFETLKPRFSWDLFDPKKVLEKLHAGLPEDCH